MTTPCWIWDGPTRGNGYGAYKSTYAHRQAWQDFYGSIPAGMQVCHHCDTPACYRPDHLFLGTQKANIADMWRKGRQRPAPIAIPQAARNAQQRALVACKHGHPFDKENTRYDRNGHRVCRTCIRLAMRKHRARQVS